MNGMHLSYFTQNNSDPYFIQYGAHDTDMPMHTHVDFSELVIVLSGTAAHKVDNETYRIQKGDVFVISKNTAHGYENTVDFRICNIMYPQDLLHHTDSDIRKSPGFHALFVIEPYFSMEHRFRSRLRLSSHEFEKLHTLLHSLIQEYTQKKDGWRTILKSQFMILVVFLSRTYSQTSFTHVSDVINFAKSVSYMEAHFNELITIEALASMSNLSTRHFARIFKATYTIPPINYLVNLRIQHACTLLKDTTLSILDVAYHCGFSDSNYFSRQFKQHLSLSPKEYRKKILHQ